MHSFAALPSHILCLLCLLWPLPSGTLAAKDRKDRKAETI